MSSLSTSINNNLNSCLINAPKLINKFTTQINITENQFGQSYETKNVYNKIDYKNLKGIKKYDNFTIFSMREKKNNQKKNKLNIRIRKNSSTLRKNNHDNQLLSQSSLYVTQNLSEGNFTELPQILEKLGSLNAEKNKNNNINKKRNKTKKIIKYKPKSLKNESGRSYKTFLLNRLKNNIKEKVQKEEKIIKFENNIYKKKLMDLNRYRMNDNYYITYIDDLHDFLNKKNTYDMRKERYLRFVEVKQNKIDAVEDQIRSMHRSQRLLDKRFVVKYQEYLASLYKEKDKLDKIDIILSTKLYTLRNEIKILEKQVNKLFIKRNTYIKWMLLQIQVKKKLLKLPKQYNIYLKNDNTTNLPKELIKYKNNIIYPTPQELINRIEAYENHNIKSLEIYHRMTLEIYPLKDELENQKRTYEKILDVEEIKKLNGIWVKLKAQNELLTKQLYDMKIELNILPLKTIRKKTHSKLYDKIKLMAINIFGKKKRNDEKLSENMKILMMLKDIELEIDEQKKKDKYYQIKYKESLEIEREKREKEKRKEKILLNKRLVEERKFQLKKSIIEKANKKFILKNKRINWNNYYIKKSSNSAININNYIDGKKENIYEYLCYK